MPEGLWAKGYRPRYDTTVANVKIFARDGVLIPLKYHIGLCRHKAAVALALLLLEKDSGYDFKTDFVTLNRATFWQLASPVKEIVL